jgi:hypothetical protein
VVICKPADPEAKGLVERSFLPGRTFASPADFNTQLTAWISLTNSRDMRVLGCRPADRVEADKAAMMPLPPVAPVTGWHASTRLPRDHYVRLDSNDYSVHPGAVGRRVDVAAGLERVVVSCDGKVVADHPRSWAKHQSFTDPAHATAAAALRRAHVAAARPPRHTDVQLRDLASYDTALGIDAGIDAGIDVAVDPDREDLGPAGSGVA